VRYRAELTATLPAIVLALCTCALALDPSLEISQYAHTAWRVRDGFAKGVITSLAQTPDGYLWVGTESGLLRFDGVRPVVWEPPEGQQLPGSLITSLLVGRDGTLWIGTFTGLARWKDGKLTQFPELAVQSVTSLLEARDGTIWIGIYAQAEGGVCDIRSQSLHCERDRRKFGAGVMALYEDSKGTLWLGASKGLWRWTPGTPQFFSIPEDPFGITSFVEDARGQLLFGSYAGIRRFVDGRVEPYPSSGSAYSWHVTRMFSDHDGGLWVGTSEHGLVHIREQERPDVFSHTDGLSGDYVTRFLEDREGCIWVATYDGIDRFRAYAIPTISTKQGLSSPVALSVLASKEGSVWIGTTGGLNHWKDGQISLFGSARGSPASGGKLNRETISSLFEDSRGQTWVSTAEGKVGYLQEDRFIQIPGIPRGTVLSLGEVPSGHLWVSHQQAGLLHVFDGRVLEQFSWSGIGRKDSAKVLVADPSQRGFWLGFNQGGVAYFSDGAIKASYSTKNELGEGHVTDLRFGTRGTLWVATDSGLSRIKDGHVNTLTSKNGLPCDKVVATMEDNDHSMWLYLACGLVRITRAELDGWVAAPSKVVTVELFDTSDGVRGHSASGGFQPLMAKSADGKIWFLPWDGVSVIDPHHLPINKLPPPVHIEEIAANQKIYVPSNGLQLPAHVRDLAIDYTALSLVAPEKTHFRYKLDGQDPEWREVVNVRHVQYSNLAPRHYTFRVMASNNSGVWNERGALVEFTVLPAFYQTIWFRTSCVVGFLALLWATYQLRVQQLQGQFNIGLEARVNERTRIARELHDTLLQTLHGLMFQFQAVRNLMPRKPDEAMRSLDDAIGETEKALAESRDAIQGLRSEPIAKGNLSELLMATTLELASSATPNHEPPAFELIEEGERRALSPTTKNEVCRIALEILRNAYRHAQAHRIEAEVRYGDHILRLRVRDDGKGIDPGVLKEGGIVGHWGLRGIRERAERIGAQLEFWSEAGAGTEVQLTVPASVAYENASDGVGSRLLRKVRNRAQHS
jgi:signal transduction histidine kinase/ligand-binding sensor domain-containing protein